MTRVPIPHRKPRTRRERLLTRFHGARDDVQGRWQRLRHRRKHRAAHARVRKVFMQLQHRPHLRADLVVERERRLHLRHAKH